MYVRKVMKCRVMAAVYFPVKNEARPLFHVLRLGSR